MPTVRIRRLDRVRRVAGLCDGRRGRVRSRRVSGHHHRAGRSPARADGARDRSAGGHFLGIFARSSTPLKRGLMVANGVGVVDSDYCGPTDEIKIPMLNFTSAPVQVSKGDRIAQGILLPSPRVEWEEVDELRTGSRGGFGATGRYLIT